VVSSSGVSGLSIGWRRSGIHSTEAASHFLEGVIWEELQLEKQEESEESRLEETGDGGRKTSGSDWESEAGNPGGSEPFVLGLDSTMS